MATTAGEDFVLKAHAVNKKKVRDVSGTTLEEHVPFESIIEEESSLPTDISNKKESTNGTPR